MIWPRRLTQKALLFIFMVLLIHIALFPHFILPWSLLFFGITAIVAFFNGLNYFTRKWKSIPNKSFIRSLFVSSLIIKVIFLICTLVLITIVDPNSFPFEIGGGSDSKIYHKAGSDIADSIFKNSFISTLKYWYRDKSDFGYPTYVGFIYFVFWKSTIWVKFISIFFSAFTNIFIYKIARNIYNESVARFAGIMAMLIPVILWFDTMSVKESIMTFLIYFTLYLSSELVQSRRINLFKAFVIVAAIYLLFYFRLFLVPLLSMVVAVYLLLNLSNRKVSKIPLLVAVFIVVVALSSMFVETEAVDDFQGLMVQSKTLLEDEIVNSTMRRGLSVKTSLVAPLMLVGAVVTPFPSLLYFSPEQLTMVSHFFNELIRNCLYFFVFVGIWVSFKKHFKESSLIMLFTFGYIFILAVSGRSFQDRFQFPAFPGIIIMISAGYILGKKYLNKWSLYLFFMGIAILMWNLFKLSIRGLL